MTTKKVGIWIRVSTEDQAKGESPEHHEKRARMYAEVKGWQVVKVYRLEGVSGKDVTKSPETERMLQDIKAKRIEALIFSKLARLARNTKQLLEFSDYFQTHGADLVSLQESIDTSSPAGRLFYTLIAAMAQWEREEIAERIAASVPIRAQLGKNLGGQAPYGYRWNKHQLEIDEKEAPIRRRMFELYLEHQRKKTVVKILNDEGIRTRSGAKWSSPTITRLLRDTIAKGLRRTNYSTKASQGEHMELKPKEDWIFVPAPAIVPEELWDKVNALLDKQAVKRNQPLKKPKHLFTGLVQCACGKSNMYGISNSPKYVCRECKNKIRRSDLEEIYHEQLKSIVLSDELISENLKENQSLLQKKQSLLESLEQEMKEVKQNIDSLLLLHVDGQIPTEGFREHYDPLFTQKTQLQESILELQTELDYLKTHLPSADEILYQVKDIYSRWTDLTFDEKRAIVETITESIIVGEQDITINLKHFPNTEMAHPSKKNTFGGQTIMVLQF